MSTDTPKFDEAYEAKIWILSNAGAIAAWISLITSTKIFAHGPAKLLLLPLVLNVCGIVSGVLARKYPERRLWMVGNYLGFILAVVFGLIFLLFGTQWICGANSQGLCGKLGGP